jgi:glycogen debranching enzyme-like protein/mannosylglycerate hydrolase MGH1-like protein
VLCDPDGQVRRGGVRGWFVDDVRLVDQLTIAVEGSGLEPVRSFSRGADRQEYTYVARELGGWLHDPTVSVERRRSLGPAGLAELIEVHSRAPEPVELVLYVDVVVDLAPMAAVRQGKETRPVVGEPTDSGWGWSRDGRGARVALDPPPDRVERAGDADRLVWTARLTAGDRMAVTLDFAAEGDPSFAPGGAPPWGRDVAVDAPDQRLGRLVERSLADLGGLLMRDGDDAFVSAGSPWFLTLFGRDALWTARLLLPFGTGLALSTLRALARRQGVRADPDSEEQPGKILHEVRSSALELGGMRLPPVYYGSVDATPLFVCTLVDAWRWGADAAQVAALLPAVRRCLGWVMEQSRGSGWLRYVDASGRGLANQGWKDSVDAVRHADGRLAEPPIALSEVQAYAYEAAVGGAALLEAFGEPPVDGLARWAEDLRTRFRDAFWVDTPDGAHVAIALDRTGAPAASVTSNMGHLLGTGILAEEQTARVVEVLTGPDLSSGFGLRTLSSASPGYSPLSYHGGSVWPHDTAVAVRGLGRVGRVAEAAALAAGLVAVSEGVGYRLPELYGGDAAVDVPFPTAYPAACRPQAWAAAAPLACLVAATGLEVDAPSGRTTLPALGGTALGPFTLHGLRFAGRPTSVSVGASGAVEVVPADRVG